jgi:DNA-3-methyladenine glycosylase II
LRNPSYWPQATRELAAHDPVLAALVRDNRGLTLGARGNAFQTLARAVVGQQISVKAAQSVWDRLVQTVETITPDRLIAAEVARLREAGLSGRKVEYLQDLARHFQDRSVDAKSWRHLPDESVIEQLTSVRGIGRWTAEMFLIFSLGRPNVLPLGDLGLRRAMSLSYGRGRELSERRMRLIGKRWEPWCSVATWYMWRSLDPMPIEY